ncbi:MAG: ATP-binding protein [Spirochaetales bacterium]|nr:ATP-binding protein [Spirochaetales bacterium]
MEENDEKNEALAAAINTVDYMVNKKYLSFLSSLPIDDTSANIENGSRIFNATQLVFKKKENLRDKLTTVFNAVGSYGSSLVFIIHGNKNTISINYGVKSSKSEKKDIEFKNKISTGYNILKNGFEGNFPGSIITTIEDDKNCEHIKNYIPENSFVASITDIASLRKEEENPNREFVQGIEKFIDTMNGKEFTLMVLADAVSLQELNNTRALLENLYTSLVPFAEYQKTVGINESASLSHSITKGTTETITNTFTQTHQEGSSKGKNSNPMALIGPLAGAAAFLIPGVGSALGLSTMAACAVQGGMVGASVGGVFGLNSSKNVSESDSGSNGDSKSEMEQKSEQISQTKGTNESLQVKFENKTVKQILNKIDEILKRIDKCADLGMWNCAAYCISNDQSICQIGANSYHALVRGKNSSLENGCVTLWDKDKSKIICSYLKKFEHPIINARLTPGTLVSSEELAIHAGLPKTSVPGIPVIECTEFGRTVRTYDNQIKNQISDEKGSNQKTIKLGSIYHMYKPEAQTVDLNKKSLCSHTFITGSTGSGKSNTIYHILSQMLTDKIPFMVIEPAKGEYKKAFIKETNVHVYGTDFRKTMLLRLNPFSFPKKIHILEHIERLIEIFNVCWPMYAAMPQVLKDAVCKAYEDTGWNLELSKNISYAEDPWKNKKFPSFKDVLNNIKEIINKSEYSSDTQGDYKGSLETRLRSLTNGLNGQIFSINELSPEELFNNNVIIDLSSVGAGDTKSLIMGMLILKLQEFRMSEADKANANTMNSELKHITVIEEAHNLLKKTSTEQSNESSNLAGKSVEMITNAIAEMRTYGEGFIIADQAPGLLDMAVIRNTNTKIIMRIPDYSDRELVGKAANLNDEQIKELARLPRGVAAVYQNEWVEPVLCAITKSGLKEETKYEKPDKKFIESLKNETLKERIDLCSKLCRRETIDYKNLDSEKLGISVSLEIKMNKLVDGSFITKDEAKDCASEVVSELLPEMSKKLMEISERTSDFENAKQLFFKSIEDKLFSSEEEKRIILSNLVIHHAIHVLNQPDLVNKKVDSLRG